MGYLFAFLALAVGGIKGFCGKKTSTYVSRTRDAFLFNFVRMLFCILIGFVIVAASGDLDVLPISGSMFWVSLLGGFANALFVTSWMLAVRVCAYMMVEVSLMLGCLLPTVGCAVFYGEAISWKKMLGFALLIAAVVIMSGYNLKLKGKMKPGGILLMILAGLGEGSVSFSQQLYKHSAAAENYAASGYTETVYNFYLYVFAALFLLLFFLLFLLCAKKEEDGAEKHNIFAGGARVYFYIVIMAACLFAYSYFSTLATTAGGLSSQVLYPLLKGGALILSTIMAAVFFGEKVTKFSIIGTCVAFAGLIVINVL